MKNVKSLVAIVALFLTNNAFGVQEKLSNSECFQYALEKEVQPIARRLQVLWQTVGGEASRPDYASNVGRICDEFAQKAKELAIKCNFDSAFYAYTTAFDVFRGATTYSAAERRSYNILGQKMSEALKKVFVF
jgi:hypothetical protein